ncbi:MAG: FKBP-type peptidyl-prolyl cis-trans isomerase [Opitutaceae bacterium]
MTAVIRRIFPLLLLLAFLAPVLRAQREKLPEEDLEFVEKNFPNAKKTNTGIRYIIQTEGNGEPAHEGDLVKLLYVGRLLDGTVFDQNNDRVHPFSFRVGRAQVIEGWDQIMQLMKPGERRIVIIPPELAYGMRGFAPRIPRNATLVFLIELLDIQREE